MDIEIELIPCPKGRFGGDNETVETLNIVNNYFCPKDINFTMEGSLASTEYSYIYISIIDCR